MPAWMRVLSGSSEPFEMSRQMRIDALMQILRGSPSPPIAAELAILQVPGPRPRREGGEAAGVMAGAARTPSVARDDRRNGLRSRGSDRRASPKTASCGPGCAVAARVLCHRRNTSGRCGRGSLHALVKHLIQQNDLRRPRAVGAALGPWLTTLYPLEARKL